MRFLLYGFLLTFNFASCAMDFHPCDDTAAVKDKTVNASVPQQKKDKDDSLLDYMTEHQRSSCGSNAWQAFNASPEDVLSATDRVLLDIIVKRSTRK